MCIHLHLHILRASINILIIIIISTQFWDFYGYSIQTLYDKFLDDQLTVFTFRKEFNWIDTFNKWDLEYTWKIFTFKPEWAAGRLSPIQLVACYQSTVEGLSVIVLIDSSGACQTSTGPPDKAHLYKNKFRVSKSNVIL